MKIFLILLLLLKFETAFSSRPKTMEELGLVQIDPDYIEQQKKAYSFNCFWPEGKNRSIVESNHCGKKVSICRGVVACTINDKEKLSFQTSVTCSGQYCLSNSDSAKKCYEDKNFSYLEKNSSQKEIIEIQTPSRSTR